MTELDKFLSGSKANFVGCCGCPGCFNRVLRHSIICGMCIRVESRLKAAVPAKGSAGYMLQRWLALPQQTSALQAKVHINVARDDDWWIFERAIARHTGCWPDGSPWEEPPTSLYEIFEQQMLDGGTSFKACHGTDKRWFANRESFCKGLHSSGFVVLDLHGDCFPEANQAIFIQDFSTATCRQCSRPAIVKSLEGREQFAHFPEQRYRESGKLLHKGMPLVGWHPMLRLIQGKECKTLPQLQLCARHANERVTAAILARLCTQVHRCKLPSEIGDKIAFHVLTG